MPYFSARSKNNLSQCDERLQRLFNEVIKHFDCSVIEGHRSKDRQNQMVEAGMSKLRWPHSKHNQTPSLAVDVVPYPIDWHDRQRFYLFGGFVLGIASQLSIPIRWGGDWDGDKKWRDQSFHDLPHFEIKEY